MPYPLLLVLFLAAPLAAQSPSVIHFGSPCPSGAAQRLSTQGTPRLGSTFTVRDIWQSTSCANGCMGPAFLMAGAQRTLQAVILPGFPGCSLLVTRDAVFHGNARNAVDLPIPGDARLLGLPFYLQSVELRWRVAGSGLVLDGVHFSDGVECIIGT